MFDLDDEDGNDIDTSEKIINDNDKGSNNNTISLSFNSSNENLEDKKTFHILLT